MSLLSHQGLLMSAAGGMSLSDLILSLSPTFYCRHAEASGLVMENETSADGGYTGSGVTLAQPALYTGGPTSVAFSTGSGSLPASVMPASSVPAITLLTIIQPVAVSGVRQIISRDADSGDRLWQWRFNGANLEWIKIVGGVTTTARAHGISAGNIAMLGVTVTAGGVVSIFKNGTRLGATATIAAANYGSDTRTININSRAGGVEPTANGYSESAGWNSALSDATMLELAEAGGFA